MTTLLSERGKSLRSGDRYILAQRYEDLEPPCKKTCRPNTLEPHGRNCRTQRGHGAARRSKLMAGITPATAHADSYGVGPAGDQHLQAFAANWRTLCGSKTSSTLHKWLAQLVSYDTLAIYCACGDNIELAAARGAKQPLVFEGRGAAAALALGRRAPKPHAGDQRRCPSRTLLYQTIRMVVQKLQSTLAVRLNAARCRESWRSIIRSERF